MGAHPPPERRDWGFPHGARLSPTAHVRDDPGRPASKQAYDAKKKKCVRRCSALRHRFRPKAIDHHTTEVIS